MILITIDRSKCRGLYLCDCCLDQALHLKISAEDGEMIVADFAGEYLDAAQCPDNAITIRSIG